MNPLPPPPPLSKAPTPPPADAVDPVKQESGATGGEPLRATGGDAMAVDAPSEIRVKEEVKEEKVVVKSEDPATATAPPPPPPPLAPTPPPPTATGLAPKEALLLLQRLASLDKHGLFDTPALKARNCHQSSTPCTLARSFDLSPLMSHYDRSHGKNPSLVS